MSFWHNLYIVCHYLYILHNSSFTYICFSNIFKKPVCELFFKTLLIFVFCWIEVLKCRIVTFMNLSSVVCAFLKKSFSVWSHNDIFCPYNLKVLLSYVGLYSLWNYFFYMFWVTVFSYLDNQFPSIISWVIHPYPI